FTDIEGVPVQVIQPRRRMEVPVDDLSTLDDEAQQQSVAAALKREWELPFDLSRGPVLRTRLLKLSDRDHILLATFHHIVSDGWSQGVFDREFRVIYEALSEGRDNPLLPLPVQYADFALWQRTWLDGETMAVGLQYWKDQLSGIPDQISLPVDRPRSAVQTYAASVCVSTAPVDLVIKLNRIARDSGGTLYMTLLAGFALLLHRYTTQDDIVVGSPIAN